MGTITITIDTDNAAFSENEAQEVTRILETLTAKIGFDGQLQRGNQSVRDINGNTVGKVEVK